MGEYSVVLAILLGFFIIFIEVVNYRKTRRINILSLVNLTFLMCFCMVPVLVYYYFEDLHLWTSKNNIQESVYLRAMAYAVISYISILFSYIYTSKKRIQPLIVEENKSKIKSFSFLLLFIGWMSLLIFIVGIGGISNFFSTNTLYRSGNIEVSAVAFMRNIALLIPVSTYIMYYLIIKNKNKGIGNSLFNLFFLLNFLVSIAIYFNRAGRLTLVIYVVTFFIIYSHVKKKSLRKYILAISVPILLFLFYGKAIFNYFVVGYINFNDNPFRLEEVMEEFIFPFFTLANSVKYPFFGGEPRFFIDFVYGILNLLPSSMLNFEVPKTTTQLNTISFGDISGIPIDLISLGFHSLGLAGVLIISIVFGWVCAFAEKKLSNNNTNILIVFYAQFLSFIPLRIPYAEPTNFLKSYFALLAAFVLFLVFFKKKNKCRNLLLKGEKL